jgi:hypothetical protein
MFLCGGGGGGGAASQNWLKVAHLGLDLGLGLGLRLLPLMGEREGRRGCLREREGSVIDD